MTLKQRFVNTLLDVITKTVNKDVDVQTLQRKYSAPGGRVVIVEVTDVGYRSGFVLDPVTHKILAVNTRDGCPVLRMPLTTLVYLVRGTDDSGRLFTPNIAWAHGYMEVIGPNGSSWLSDARLFQEVYSMVFPQVKGKLGI